MPIPVTAAGASLDSGLWACGPASARGHDLPFPTDLRVASRLAPPAAFDALRFRPRLLETPVPFEFAVANGAAWVSTGLLARLESEAELAAVLGHELSHVERRHHADQLRKAEEWTDEFLGLREASTARHGRELELEADADAIARMRAAGYDPADAVRMLEHVRAFLAAAGQKDLTTPRSLVPKTRWIAPEESTRGGPARLVKPVERLTSSGSDAERVAGCTSKRTFVRRVRDGPAAAIVTRYVPGRTAEVEDMVSWTGSDAVRVVLEKVYERPGTGGEAASEREPWKPFAARTFFTTGHPDAEELEAFGF